MRLLALDLGASLRGGQMQTALSLEELSRHGVDATPFFLGSSTERSAVERGT